MTKRPTRISPKAGTARKKRGGAGEMVGSHLRKSTPKTLPGFVAPAGFQEDGRNTELSLPSIRPPAGHSSSLQHIFHQRSLNALARISRNATDEALASALAAPTDIGALARVLADAMTADTATRELDPFAAALARNAQHREELVSLSGGLVTAPDVGKTLGITRQAVDKRRKNQRLLAVKVAGDWRYPAFQFDDRLPETALAEVIDLLADPTGWSALDFLLTRDDVLDGKTPAEALTLGPAWIERVWRLARGERGDGFS